MEGGKLRIYSFQRRERTMQKVQKTSTSEFKREAVRLAQTSGKAIAHVARELGISDSSIHQWRKELTEHGPEAFPGSGHQTAQEEEVRRDPPRTRDCQTGARHSKKSYQHLFARKAMRYQFIAEHRHEYPILLMCRVLAVSGSGYYAWCKRLPSRHNREDAELAEHVKTVFQA